MPKQTKHKKRAHSAKSTPNKRSSRASRQDTPLELPEYPEQRGAEFQSLNRITPGSAEGDRETVDQDLAEKENKRAA